MIKEEAVEKVLKLFRKLGDSIQIPASLMEIILAVKELNEVKPTSHLFKVGDKVQKVGGDYKFEGIVVCVFQKLSGQVRLVVEDDRGVLHVYSEKNLNWL